MISMLTDYKIMKLSYHSCLSYIDIVIPDKLYHLEGPYPFFFLGLSWLRLTVNRGLTPALINPQLTPIICSVCQGPLLMRLFNLHLPSAAVTLP